MWMKMSPSPEWNHVRTKRWTKTDIRMNIFYDENIIRIFIFICTSRCIDMASYNTIFIDSSSNASNFSNKFFMSVWIFLQRVYVIILSVSIDWWFANLICKNWKRFSFVEEKTKPIAFLFLACVVSRSRRWEMKLKAIDLGFIQIHK